MIHAIAIDDEPLPLQILEQFCRKSDVLQLDKTFTQTSEAMRYFKNYPVDLLFLDIQMPVVSGIDFYKSLGQNTMVIFTTAHSQYAVQGFELSAIDYLLKPYSFERFTQAVQKAKVYYDYLKADQQQAQHIFFRVDYSLVQVALKDIQYIESFGDYLKVHLEGKQKALTMRMTMKEMAEKLPAQRFFRVHRSYIIPLDRIQKIRHKVVMVADVDIPIGAAFEEEFLLKIK
jgi:DNA-binding LytR/AlgR family response regulator